MCSCAFGIMQGGWRTLVRGGIESPELLSEVTLCARVFDVSQNPQGKARLYIIIAIKWESHHIGAQCG